MVVKHWQECHSESATPPNFSYKLVKVHRSALERQLDEGMLIGNDKSDILLNSKNEFGHNNIIVQQTRFGDRVQVQQEVKESNNGRANAYAVLTHSNMEYTPRPKMSSICGGSD